MTILNGALRDMRSPAGAVSTVRDRRSCDRDSSSNRSQDRARSVMATTTERICDGGIKGSWPCTASRKYESKQTQHNCFTPLTKENLNITTMDIGKELAALCKQGKNQEVIDRFYSPSIESVEPVAMPGMGQTQKRIQAVKGKNQWWVDNRQIHGGTSEEYFSRMFKKAVQQGRNERRGEEVHTSLRVDRSPLQWVLANGKAPTAFSTSEKLLLNVEPLSDARTMLADIFNILRSTRGNA